MKARYPGIRVTANGNQLVSYHTATRIAEWFRDQGRDVVLMMDSITRMCQGQRQIGLAAREPPATRGYRPFQKPPSSAKNRRWHGL